MNPNDLLTILGLAVAVYTIIPQETRLDLGLRLSKIDRIVIFLSLALVHYIIFYPVLKGLGCYIDLGSWRWGLNPQNTTYLIFLLLTCYLFFRTKTAKITTSNIKGFGELFERLLLEKKLGELALLLEQHFGEIVEIRKSESLRNRLAKWLDPKESLQQFLEKKSSSEVPVSNWTKLKKNAGNFIKRIDEHQETALVIFRRLLDNTEFVNYLSESKPDLCISILRTEVDYHSNFLNLFIRNLIENRNSIFYFELAHTQNIKSNNRFEIPKSNKLLSFLLSDVKNSERLAIYKPIGDQVCEIIDYNNQIVHEYNENYDSTFESKLQRCPIACSLHFFEVMILEAMHQGVKWHMWLLYFSTFAKKIIAKIRDENVGDQLLEYPTPFHFLLYRIISIQLVWIEEFQFVEDKKSLLWENEDLKHDNGSIPKSATLDLGNVVFAIVSSNAICGGFKINIIEKVARFMQRHQKVPELQPLINVLMKSVLFNGYHNQKNQGYLKLFKFLYENIDDFIQYELKEFNRLLEDSIETPKCSS